MSPQRLAVLSYLAMRPNKLHQHRFGNRRTWWSLVRTGHAEWEAILWPGPGRFVRCDGFRITCKGLTYLKEQS
jgi:hypothetical protein